MAARTRTRDYAGLPGGSVQVTSDNGIGNFTYTPTAPVWAERTECVDNLSPHTDNSFYLYRRRSTVTGLSGRHTKTSFSGNKTHYDYRNFTPETFKSLGAPNAPGAPAVDIPRLATNTVARSNPSRADADLAVTLGEMRDLPRLIQRAGNSMLERMTNANLALEFGFKPLMRDIITLIEFHDVVEKRMKELKAIRDNNSYRRKVNHQSYMLKGKPTKETATSVALSISAICATQVTQKVWGTTRWEFRTPAMRNASDAQLRSAALRAAYGMTIDISTVWNLIPFSWMSDWFGNTGNFLDANRNTVGAWSSGTCVMSHTIKREIKYLALPDGLSGGLYQGLAETKRRDVAGATPFASTIPILSSGQLSILGNLGFQSLSKLSGAKYGF